MLDWMMLDLYDTRLEDARLIDAGKTLDWKTLDWKTLNWKMLVEKMLDEKMIDLIHNFKSICLKSQSLESIFSVLYEFSDVIFHCFQGICVLNNS
jgi:hypothetical protein